jgi:hypothetical protein
MTEDGTDALYALDPGEFVAARNVLAKQLRKAGDREAAGEVAKLRRPSPPAWAVNQLVRRHRADVEELVGLGEALRHAQDRALAGEEPGDLRAAARARREALARLAEKAERILAERGATPGAHAAEVGATLEAASLDAGAAEAVLAGRLSTELEPPSGFGVFEGVVAEPSRPRARPAPPEAASGPQPDRRELDEAEATAAEARERWEERSAQARAAVERVAERQRDVKSAEAEVARLEDLLEQAQRAARRAVREAERAEDAASQAEDVAAKAAQRLRAADQRVAELGG